MHALHNRLQKSTALQNVSMLVSTCRKLSFLMVHIVPHWSYLTCFRQDHTFICLHVVAAKPSSAAVSALIHLFIHSFIHPSIHQTCGTGLLLSRTNNYGKCWLSLASTEAASRGWSWGKEARGHGKCEVFFLAFTFGCDRNFKHLPALA